MLLTVMRACCTPPARPRQTPLPLKHRLQALKHNEDPGYDHGVEVLYRFADFDPFRCDPCMSGGHNAERGWRDVRAGARYADTRSAASVLPGQAAEQPGPAAAPPAAGAATLASPLTWGSSSAFAGSCTAPTFAA